MADEAAPVAGPRRYRISFNCRVDAVGAVIGLLIKEVENPKMEAIGDSFKLTLICMHDQVVTVLGVVMDHADNLIVAPFVPEVKMQPATFIKPRAVHVPNALERDVTHLPAQRKRVKGGARTKDTAGGKALLSAFEDGRRVKHPPDFAEALVKKGFAGNSSSALLWKLCSEKDLVRVGHAAYRLPTVQDQLAVMADRDTSFLSDKDK